MFFNKASDMATFGRNRCDCAISRVSGYRRLNSPHTQLAKGASTRSINKEHRRGERKIGT